VGVARGRRATAAAVAASKQIPPARVTARTEKACPKCPQNGPQPLSAFGANKCNADGLAVWCKLCANADRRARRAKPAPELFECPDCHQSLPLAAFYASSGQRTARCTPCRTTRPPHSSSNICVPSWHARVDHHAPLTTLGVVAPAVRTVPDEIDLPCCTAEFADGGWRHSRSCAARSRPAR
jgi:hypothetical protein